MIDPRPIAVLGQRSVRWSATVTIAGNSTVRGVVDGLDLSRSPGTLSVTVTGSNNVTVLVTERWQNSETSTTFSLGLDGSLQMYVSGSVTVDVINGQPGAATCYATLNPGQGLHSIAPVDALAALPSGGGAVPAVGPWVTVGPTGYPPDARTSITLIPQSDPGGTIPGIDLQLLSPTGGVAASWRATEPQTFNHPPRYRLQARHPGGAGNDPRAVVATWSRGA